MKTKVLILGAGTAGISVAARLARKLGPDQVMIVDPATYHYYQPLWTLVGAGIEKKESTERPMLDLIPKGVQWIKESVVSVNPKENFVHTTGSLKISYEYLIVATGLKLSWEKIEGAEECLGKEGVCTIYEYNQVDYAYEQIKQLKGGRALFVMPPPPIKCAGAPQKIMYLADELFRKSGVRANTEIFFATPGKAMFGVPVFAEALGKIVQERDIHPKYLHKIVDVDGKNKNAIFEVTQSNGTTTREAIQYDLLHIVPPMEAHSYLKESQLAVTEGDQKGWLAVDKKTLQHLNYSNVFGIGDVTGVPNSKTGAAIRKQAPIVVDNLLSLMKGKPLAAEYDGYSSCPLVTEIGKVMLAEFGYDGKLLPSFPLDPTIPRRSYWHLKKDLLPKMYWWGMLKGLI